MEAFLLLVIGAVVYFGTSAIVKSATRERPEQKAQRLELAIVRNTDNWTKPLIVATYPSGPQGIAVYADEAPILANHGYFAITQTTDGSHLHAGRLLATGGLSVLAGQEGIRSKGTFTVTYRREPPAG